MVKDQMEENSLFRALRIGNMGFRIAGSYLNYQAQNLIFNQDKKEENRKAFHKNSARQLRDNLQMLRGPIMKLGQTLSMQSHHIPEDFIEELTSLQMHAPPMHPTLMRTQFKKSVGKYPEEIFPQFELEPFAAASLGQVHRAVTPDGDDVAVKIQYPAIRNAIENDFALLRTISLPVQWAKYFTKEMIQEVEEGILKETDYINEAQNIETFQNNLSSYAYVKIPKVYKEYSTDKVLTMSYMEGIFLDELLQLHLNQKQRDKIGTRLMEVFFEQAFVSKVLHADPHPGNYLYDKDKTIAMIDFGCVKHLPGRIVDCFLCFMETVGTDNPIGVHRFIELIWGVPFNSSLQSHQNIAEAIREYQALIHPKDRDTVDFGKPDLLDTLTSIWHKVLKHQLVENELFFISRAELGLFNVLYRLGARVKTKRIWQQFSPHPAVC